MDIGYYNGKLSPLNEMTVPLNDRAMYFGDGVYDATMCKNGKILDFEDHLARFESSLKKLSIPMPCSLEKLSSELYRIAALGEPDKWYMLYWSSTRAIAPREHAFPANVPSNLIITLTEKPGMRSPKQTMKLITFEDRRFEYCDIKTLNLIPSCLAAQAAREAGCEEAVFHRGNQVTECAHSNISILQDGTLRTAQTDAWILPGIARKNLIRCAKAIGIPVREERFTLEELFAADEIIVSSSRAQLTPATEINGISVGQKAPDLLEALARESTRSMESYMGFSIYE